MEKRNYPYKAWVLMPSFTPKQVELVSRAYEHSYPEYDTTATGKDYHVVDLHATKEAAIAEGRARLADQVADLEKRAERIEKRKAALDKAEQ